MPSIATPGQEPQPFAPPSPANNQQGTTAPSTTWLLDRYDRLDTKRAAERGREPVGKAGHEKERLDPNDPDYFLKLYERQRTEAAEKERKRAGEKAGTGMKTDALANPFTPFLKEWLTGSPVGDLVRESLRMSGTATDLEREDSFAAAPGATALGAGNSASARNETFSSPGDPAPSNPYLQALTISDLPPRTAMPSAVPPPAPRPVAPENAPPPPRLTPQEELRRALPARTDEAKKYFPQLKKF
jgi:hypothetical protein